MDLRRTTLLISFVGACQKVGPPSPIDETSTETTAPQSTSSGQSTSTSGSSSGTAESGGTAESSSSTGDALIVPCNLYDQDCATGQKCQPYRDPANGCLSESGQCTPLLSPTAGLGQTCEVASLCEGLDNCDRGLYCAFDTCLDLCDEPCPADQECRRVGGEVWVCISHCAPSGAPCEVGQVCIYLSIEFGMACLALAPEPGGLLMACQDSNDCVSGWCSSSVCDGYQCCSSYCNVNDPQSCASIPGTTCSPLIFAEPVPMEWAGVGHCLK